MAAMRLAQRHAGAKGSIKVHLGRAEQHPRGVVRLKVILFGREQKSAKGLSTWRAAVAPHVVNPIEALQQPVDGFARRPWEGGETVRNILGCSNWWGRKLDLSVAMAMQFTNNFSNVLS